MSKLEVNKISRFQFMKLNENDIMFITNPGRMGDEDGSTFVIKNGNKFIAYRIDGWMYRNNKDKEYISLEDAINKFPKWYDAWKHGLEEDYKGKYKYIYMGFGNGLSVDNSIYERYKPYLDKKVEKYLEKYDDKEEMKPAAVFNVWESALVEMSDKYI